MLLRFTTILILSISANAAYSQVAHDMMVGLQADLVKTDNVNLFRKAQFSAEFHYFASSRITASAGFEIWTDDEFSFSIGSRWYPTDYAFVRIKGLIGENDIVVGGGWTKPLNERLRFEAVGDFYFKVDFAIRAGIVYMISRN